MTSWADLPVVKSLREETDARSSKAEKGKERDGDHGEESHRMEGEKQGGEGGHVEKKFKRDTDSEFLPSSLE